MNINFNVAGQERKSLVKEIEALTGESAKYMGAPSMAYTIGRYTVSRNGELSWPENADQSAAEMLVQALMEKGYEAETEETTTVISVPKSMLPGGALENLRRIVASKESLIKQALGTDEVPVTEEDDKISFPWFKGGLTSEEFNACGHLVTALCDMARNAKRVTAKEKETENAKYAFRCFLLRLGFIGEEYKAERKILLRNLAGSSAFKSGRKKGTRAILNGEDGDEQ